MFFFLQWEIIQYFCPFIKLLLFSFFIKWVIFPYQNRALVGSQWNWHDWPEVSRRIRTMPNRPVAWVVQPDGYRRSLHIETKAQAILAVCKVKLKGVMDQFKKIWIPLVFKWNDSIRKTQKPSNSTRRGVVWNTEITPFLSYHLVYMQPWNTQGCFYLKRLQVFVSKKMSGCWCRHNQELILHRRMESYPTLMHTEKEVIQCIFHANTCILLCALLINLLTIVSSFIKWIL